MPIRFACLLLLVCILEATHAQSPHRWSQQEANDWYARQGWLVGANFIPSTAVNQLEMWQAATFDTATIDRELGYAANIGMNCMRVFLHHTAWQADPEGFKRRVDTYLSIADRHHIRTLLVLFDDCWNDTYRPGKQPDPVPGKHNSGWLKDPGSRIDTRPALMDTLHAYLTDMLQTFKNDRRILGWDLYNEPGNSGRCNKSYPLLKNCFLWAGTIRPSQPLTAGFYENSVCLDSLNALIAANADVISYHCYEPAPAHQHLIDSLRAFGRPLLCTEYMARKRGSTFPSILPLLKKEHVAAINWGLVSGKTNTIYAWDERIPDGSEPSLWFHDVFRRDGTPYKKEETDLIRRLTAE